MQDSFVDFLIQEVGLEQEQALHFFSQLHECSQDWLLLSILELLPKEDATDFDQLVSSNAPSAVINQFLNTRIPHLDQVLHERLELFQNDIMEAIWEINQSKSTSISTTSSSQSKQNTSSNHVATTTSSPTPPRSISEINKNIKKAVQKGDWAAAASLVLERKKTKQTES